MRRRTKRAPPLRAPLLRVVSVDEFQPLASGKSADHQLFGRVQQSPEPQDPDLLGMLDELAIIWGCVRQKVGGANG